MLILSNKQYQALGKTSRVVATYLLDDEGNRVRKLLNESERYSKDEVEVVKSKPLTQKELYSTLGACKF